MPEEPWCDPEEETYIPLIYEAIEQYMSEHAHRSKMSQYQTERAIADFLTANQLHNNEPIDVISRQHG